METTIRLDRVQKVLFEVFRDEACPSVAWAFGEPSFDVSPAEHVNIQPIAGPTARTRRNARGRVIIPLESLEISVTSAAIGLRPIVRLNGFDFRTDTLPGDTIEDVRDRLLEEIAGDDQEPVSVSPIGTNGFLLEANDFGAIRSLALLGPLAHANAVESEPATLIEGSSSLIVQVEVWSKTSEFFRGATAIVSKIQAALQTPDVVELLLRFGVTIQDIGAPIDLSSISGRWSSRSAFDLSIALWAGWTRPADTIEIVNMTQIARDLEGLELATANYQIGS